MKSALAPQALLALCAALPLACLPPDAARSPERVTVRDSAGIRIVTHPAGPFNDTISPVPLLTIGQEGEPEYEFFRLAHVVSLGSGNVVVANGGTHELRLYESDGRYLRTVGRRGGGPAEWGFLSTVWVRTGDTLAVVDPRRRRMVYFDSAGTFVRGESFAGDLGSRSPEGRGPCFFPGLMGLLSDGARLIRGWGCMMFEGRVGRRPTIQSMVLVRPDRRDSIGAFNVGWIWERGPTPDPRDSYSLIPFSGAMRHAVGDDRIYLSEGTEMEIKVFDRYGRHVGILREDTLPPPVTRAHRDTYVSERAASSRPHPGDVPFPDRFGSYFHLILSYEGDLWARRYPRPGDELQHWVVFPARDEPARRLVVPDIRVQSVRDGRIYGYRSDTLGIQTVVVLDAGL